MGYLPQVLKHLLLDVLDVVARVPVRLMGGREKGWDGWREEEFEVTIEMGH